MKTVTEVSRISGISVRTLHHYHRIGLLMPTQVTEAGYRLYDDAAIRRLHRILLYRELGFSLARIREVLSAGEARQADLLEDQIRQMQTKIARLRSRVSLAKEILSTGVENMDFETFDPSKTDEYAQQAKLLYGKTDAYREYRQKSENRSAREESSLGSQVMDFFAQLGKMRPCAPDCEAALSWAARLQAFFTAHYYTCTPQILLSLAESYAAGGTMTENIDKAGGPGTGVFAKEVILQYIQQL